MLKRSITYTDFNGDEVTEVLYFHLTKPELIEMEVESSGGLSALLQRISENGDRKAIVAEFKKEQGVDLTKDVLNLSMGLCRRIYSFLTSLPNRPLKLYPTKPKSK